MKFFCRLVVKVKKKYLGYTTEKTQMPPLKLSSSVLGLLLLLATDAGGGLNTFFLGRGSLFFTC